MFHKCVTTRINSIFVKSDVRLITSNFSSSLRSASDRESPGPDDQTPDTAAKSNGSMTPLVMKSKEPEPQFPFIGINQL